MNRVLRRDPFLKINEEVFVNDIPWGDSLIGRFINSFIRKSKVSFNIRSIDGVTKSLRMKMDQIVEMSNIDISGDEISKVKISSLLSEIQKSVSNGDDVDTIISLVKNLINHLLISDTGNDVMVDSLDEFLEFLESLKDDSSVGDVSISDNESKSSEEESKETFYKNSRIFLQSIVDLDNDIESNVVRFKSDSGKNISTKFNFDDFNKIISKIENKGRVLTTFINKDIKYRKPILDEVSNLIISGINTFKETGDTKNLKEFENAWVRIREYYVSPSEMDLNNPNWVGVYSFYKKKWADDQRKKYGPDANVTKPGEKDRADIKKKSRDYLISKLSSVSERINESESNVEKLELHARNAWKKVLSAHNSSGIKKYVSDISRLLGYKISSGKENYKDAKETILNICKQVVMNGSSVGKPVPYSDLIKEGMNVNDISKSISLFGRYVLAFKEDQGLWASYGIAGRHIRAFIDSFDSMSSIRNQSNQPSKETKESFDLSFDNFLLILEKNKFSDIISEKFDSIFTEDVVKNFEISDEERVRIESSAKKTDEIHISDSDIIIEIVQLFNRAWRLHTPGPIPSGRTGGKVSNSVFREYEYLGSGSGGTQDSPGSGPYRNIKLWDRWYQGVSDILSDTKYRSIFSKDVVFSFGKTTSSGDFQKSGDDVKGAGKILLTFITRLLSDTTMYSDKGALPKFLEEYFGLKVDSEDRRFSYPGYVDRSRNESSSKDIDVKSVKFVRLEGSEQTSFYKPMMIFQISDDKNSAIRYVRLLKVSNDDVYCEISNGLDLQNVEFESDMPLNRDTKKTYFKISLNKFISGSIVGKYTSSDLNGEITSVNKPYNKKILVYSGDNKAYLSRKGVKIGEIENIIKKLG